MKIVRFLTLGAMLGSAGAFAQPVQSNATGPATTAEPAGTTVNPQGGVTGAALIPASPGAAHTPDPGTHLGAGNTAPGLYPNKLTRTKDILTTRTVANPRGKSVIENPGVRGGTAPLAKGSSTVSQTNLGANNTGTLNSNTQPDGQRNRAPVSGPGSTSGVSAGTNTGGAGSGTGF
jgi:hypothetical protein